jgi:hypothetical protein
MVMERQEWRQERVLIIFWGLTPVQEEVCKGRRWLQPAGAKRTGDS